MGGLLNLKENQMQTPTEPAFPQGLVVFFRIFDGTANQLARSVHPNARHLTLRQQNAYPDDYVVLDIEGRILGIYPRDFVSAILPIVMGPAHADNQEGQPPNIQTPTQGNPPRFS